MLGSLIFLSNSIPKSGSTLLFNLQRDLLLAMSGQKSCDYSVLEERDIPVHGGFLATKDIAAFASAVKGGLQSRGPLILKTHTPITPALRALYEDNDNFYVSLIVRDPLDSLLSAMDNYSRTGEFQNFKTVEQGCATSTKFFQSIYDTTVKVTSKSIPVVHYSDLISDPLATVVASFHPDIVSGIIRNVVERYLDVGKSGKKASHRFQRGALRRDITELPEDKREHVLRELASFRRKLGYGD